MTDLCFRCELHGNVTELGMLTVGGVAIPIFACALCATRLERLHHRAVRAWSRAQTLRAWARIPRRE